MIATATALQTNIRPTTINRTTRLTSRECDMVRMIGIIIASNIIVDATTMIVTAPPTRLDTTKAMAPRMDNMGTEIDAGGTGRTRTLAAPMAPNMGTVEAILHSRSDIRTA